MTWKQQLRREWPGMLRRKPHRPSPEEIATAITQLRALVNGLEELRSTVEAQTSDFRDEIQGLIRTLEHAPPVRRPLGALFLDELPQASPAVADALLQLCHGRMRYSPSEPGTGKSSVIRTKGGKRGRRKKAAV